MSATLLLADDSVTIQRVIELTFANEDIHVVATSDGEAAIQRIDAEPPDIVLADVGMPKVDGYAVAEHVKKTPALRNIPVLLLTGAFEPVDEDKARASGCDGVLVKPFEPQQLVGRVKELLSRAKNAGVAPPPPRAEAPAAALKAPTPVAEAPKPAPLPALRDLILKRAAAAREEAAKPPAAAAPPVPPVALLPAPSPAAPPTVEPPAPSPVRVQKTPTPPAPVPVERPAQAPSVPVDPRAARPESMEMEATFQREFDQLDAAFAQLDPEPVAAALDEETASDFARDLDAFRSTGDTPGPPRAFGDWDLPNPPPQPADSGTPAAPSGPPAPVSSPVPRPALVEAPTQPDQAADANEGTASPVRVSMAGAFAALLAAEQASPPPAARDTRPTGTMSEATVEEVVKRVLTRMTDDAVRHIVLDTAERLIKEEIGKIRKGQS